ncbi:patatin [Idiomarina tyrosinivorans]|uniref:Patatin n=1 Tax=Idiomarina tyrosinivorans TaxID=1445662 RepID=A0A432ZLR1_9GAMM|nr:patatin-like phospholipase family protein [Idiomarina tyrosinivorans]RUO78908.1 patatin [Idiomarina tyrosinivorans]
MKYPQHQHTALLLTGGGARAAYQVGVLRGIANMLPRNYSIPFPILCGTSAGAVNTMALGCYASCFHLGVKKLEYVWKNFHTHQVYRSRAWPVFKHLWRRFARSLQTDMVGQSPFSLLDNQPLRELLNKVFDYQRLDNNIHGGHLSALSVTASRYNDGFSISFFEGAEKHAGWQRSQRAGIPLRLNTEHLMASAAIPFVFPSVKIQHGFYGDGSVHQIAPLSPAIHLGAERILVIGLERPQMSHSHIPRRHPSSAEIAGHLLDTIFADTLNSDIERLQRINQTLDILDRHNLGHPQLRKIETYAILPSHDFNALAREYYDDMPWAIRQLLKLVGVNAQSESSILSYLLFEKRFCQKLMALGQQDAEQQADALKAFLKLPDAQPSSK